MNKYVSLKITVAKKTSDTSKEVSLYKSYLNGECPFVVTLDDDVKILGPNGEHECFVFEVMGPNLTSLLQKRPEFQIGEPWERRFTATFAKRALLDTLQALHSLHTRGVVHGDLHTGNILACIEEPSVTPETESQLKQSIADARPLKRKDGKKDLWAPSYLLEQRDLDEYFSYELQPLVKLTDLGGCKSTGKR